MPFSMIQLKRPAGLSVAGRPLVEKGDGEERIIEKCWSHFPIDTTIGADSESLLNIS
jgi:hypothetical protein